MKYLKYIFLIASIIFMVAITARYFQTKDAFTGWIAVIYIALGIPVLYSIYKKKK